MTGKMYTKLFDLFGKFFPLDENDRDMLQERFEPQSIKKKHQLIEYGQVSDHFFFINEGLLLTQHRLAALMKFYTSFIFDSPEARYQEFLKNHPDLVQRVPQHIIASFLGVTPVSLSRIRKRIYSTK
jgi:CRP-like cAMP-binding protein